MSRVIVLVSLLAGLLLGCTAPAPLPTLLPTLTPAPPTATASPTPPPSPTATATQPPTPTATPSPTAAAQRPAAPPVPPGLLAAPAGNLPLPMPLSMALDIDWNAYQFVVQALQQTEKGRAYWDLYLRHREEWLALQESDPAWAMRTHQLFKTWEPAAQALRDGRGDAVMLTAVQVDGLRVYVDDLAAVVSPDMAAALRAESAAVPWEGLKGVSVNAAWAAILLAPPPAPAASPPPPTGTPSP